jgi:pyruvate,water dikinase
MARRAEAHFGAPQDVEWTMRAGRLFLLQSRPVTTAAAPTDGDPRAWYLSLHRSFENLKALRRRIEGEHLPAIARDAAALAAVDCGALDDGELAAEIRRRREINQAWVDVYWSDFIPFAHGIRLFGQIYNDALKPEDPYEFVDLLAGSGLLSVTRNRWLEALAAEVRAEPRIAECLRRGDCTERAPEFRRRLEEFIGRFGDLSCAVTGGTQCEGAARPLSGLLLEMAARGASRPAEARREDPAARVRRFLEAFPEGRRAEAAERLELARASYRLRDDDNIAVARIEAELLAAVNEGRRRLDRPAPDTAGRRALRAVLEGLDFKTRMSPAAVPEPDGGLRIRPRQLIGQPAGPGLARGRARVIRAHSDLAHFAAGEVLVCDAVDPNMTFVVPLAAAVVERRGGMLIHGAIIAREYGLPCVTGVPDAAALIRTGDELTVDGYLGIVTVA